MDYDTVVARIDDFLREKVDEAGADGYVLGVSGGLDSALAADILVDAVGSDRVHGMVLPGEPSSQENMADARELCESLGITYREASIQPIVDHHVESMPYEVDKLTVGNIRARVRMVYLYEEANAHNLLVVGPDNRSEYMLGYFTKYGDGAADVCPLADLYKTEVYDLARHVGLDEKFIEKKPTAELWEGQTDEGELGASYETIDAVLRRAIDQNESVDEIAAETDVDRDLVEKFVEMHRTTEHKRTRPPTPGIR